MSEYLTFRRMITPVFIQVIFWVVVAVIVIVGIVRISDGDAGPGLLLIILGPIREGTSVTSAFGSGAAYDETP